MRSVEDAIARQVFHGGDLPTNLLELGAVREDMLTAILAESLGLEPAPLGRLASPPQRILRLVPGELALRHGIYPLDLVLDGGARALVVATSEPLAASVEDDLGFALELSIRQVIAPLVRVHQAIADSYGIPLDRRYLRLLAKLDGSHDPSPSALPPPERHLLPVKMPRPISIPSPSFGTGVPGSSREPARLYDDRPAAKTPFVAAHDFVNPTIPRSPGVPLDALDALDAERTEPEPELKPEPEPAFLGAELAATMPAEPLPVTAPRLDAGSTRALAGVLKKALRDELGSAPVDKTPSPARPVWKAPGRRKGPFTAAMAERELEETTASDAVLEVLFAFGQQFFAYTALFVVHGDLAEGRDASGAGADRARVAGIGVPLDLPSSLALVRSRREPFIGKLGADGLDAELARDLERAPGAAVVALLPVLVRNRVVAMLYGDDGAADVELSAIGDALAILGLAGAALERIALRKKLGARAPEIPVKVRIQEAGAPASAPPMDTRATGAVALARALASSAQEAVAAEEASSPATPASNAVAASTPRPDVAMFDVSRPDESAVGPPGPRTARYFDDEPGAEPALPGSTSLRQTSPGMGIHFPDATPAPEAPPDEAVRVDSWIPAADAVGRAPAPAPAPAPIAAREPESSAERPPAALAPRATSGAMRRGPAPVYEGRSASKASAPTTSFEPLPRTPPPNATAWTSFPSSLPPPPSLGTLSGQRPRSDPPIPREDDEPARLPSVVVDVGAEYQSLLQRVIEGGRGSHECFEELVKHGEHAIQAVMARFPGPLRVDRHRARAELPAASQCGPILELVVAIRRPALPFLSGRLSSTDAEVRFWATHVLGELRYPEAATTLLPRLFDDDPSVRRIARRSAAALISASSADSVGAPILKGLDDITRNRDEAQPHRVLAIETMGEIRTGSMAPPLIAALEDASDEIAEAARRALLVITRQDYGLDLRRWQEWYARNGARHRIEWLIDALMHEQPSLRRAAGDELKLLTKEYFGYYDDLPKRERERAQALYRAWWEREGRARFG